MKKILLVILITVLFVWFPALVSHAEEKSNVAQDSIAISGAWALYPMAVKWADEYQKIHPEIKINISGGGAGKGMADCLSKAVDLGMVSRNIYPVEENKGAWAIPVAKDAVVATINANNPVVSDILAKGITQEQLRQIFISKDIAKWGGINKSDLKDPIHVYTRSDACGAAETWAKYLGKLQEDLVGIGVYGDPGVAEAVKKDNLGIGYNNINYAYDINTKAPIDGICIVPIDQNADGKIDEKENFYSNLDTIASAIADGRYPSPPARELFLVSCHKPEKKEVRDFLRWALTDGQKFVPETGYINLTNDKLADGIKRLGND